MPRAVKENAPALAAAARKGRGIVTVNGVIVYRQA